MSLEKIIASIIAEAEREGDTLIRDATARADALIQDAHQEAGRLYGLLCRQEKQRLDRERQTVLVKARLDARKQVLRAKQELISELFDALKPQLALHKPKKKEIFPDRELEAAADMQVYVATVRADLESQVAERLFGDTAQ